MSIWVDADACPKVIKEIVCRAAERTTVQVTLVANRLLQVPPSQYISALQVADGFDVADSEIVNRLQPGDLVITADIPLAAEVLAKGGYALDPRGEMHSQDTIQAKLTMRDFMETLRASGVETGGPAALSQRDRQRFAKHLDHYVTNLVKQKPESPS